MSLLPNCIIGDIELEIKNRIQCNLIYCQVNPNILLDEAIQTGKSLGGSTICDIKSSRRSVIADLKTEMETTFYTKEFTQVGDHCHVCIHNYGASTSGVSEKVNYATSIEV